ncbi:MAG TPA: Holliday junction branch migration protein RuvA [Thermoanaerobaculia bacterium]|nr:Holliday junction branch migration protein RuvA [Thermoanaerobaculia bacterium]
MIGYLQGTLLRSSPERLLLDVGGVGYEVHIPLSTYYEIERAAARGAGEGSGSGAGTVRLFIHTHLREDGISLFGFWTEREKLLFEKLIGVSGIGPRLARVVLSGMATDDLLAALAAGDLGRLASIPGIGKKTAERMVLELRDKVRELAAGLPETPSAADQDVVSALVNLGYRAAQAERAVAAARRERPEAAFHDLLRLSLSRLSVGGR